MRLSERAAGAVRAANAADCAARRVPTLLDDRLGRGVVLAVRVGEAGDGREAVAQEIAPVIADLVLLISRAEAGEVRVRQGVPGDLVAVRGEIVQLPPGHVPIARSSSRRARCSRRTSRASREPRAARVPSTASAVRRRKSATRSSRRSPARRLDRVLPGTRAARSIRRRAGREEHRLRLPLHGVTTPPEPSDQPQESPRFDATRECQSARRFEA